MPIREENMDLFGYYSGQTYNSEKAFTSAAVNGTTIDLNSTKPANVSEYRALVKLTQDAAGGTSVSVKLQDSADGSTWADLAGCSGSEVVLASAKKGKELLNIRLPQACRRYVRAVLTPTGTFTAGKVFGNIEVVPA